MAVGLIGNFGGGVAVGGQVTKTKELEEALLRRCGSINVMDVYHIKHNPFGIIKGIRRILRDCDRVVIILSNGGYFIVNPLLQFLNRGRAKTFEVVTGGTRHERIEGNGRRLKGERAHTGIYVETRVMYEGYRELGFENVRLLPNFRDLSGVLKDAPDLSRKGKKLRVCTFSRVNEAKGIVDAISIAKILRDEITLDIIGPADEDFKERLKSLVEGAKENVTFKGPVEPSEAVDTLKKYDALLFPTRWENEGFPGTFIDAMCAGLPIVSSDLVNFREIIKNGENGFLVHRGEKMAFASKLKLLASDDELLLKMKKASYDCARLYDSEAVLPILFKDMDI